MRVVEVCRVGSWVALSVVFSGLWMGNPAVGAPVTVPNTLSVGDQYRWVFVTSSTHQATSSVISTYNTIVDDLGDNAIESDWKVIGSTEDDYACDNTETCIFTAGVSIWRLDGVKVADDYLDLWDGSIDASISIDEHAGSAIGEGIDPRVWTGTNWGPPAIALGEGVSIFGLLDEVSGGWLAKSTDTDNENYRLYGMSEVFTVEAAAVPEPSSAILLGVGVICVGWSRYRPKRRQASSTV